MGSKKNLSYNGRTSKNPSVFISFVGEQIFQSGEKAGPEEAKGDMQKLLREKADSFESWKSFSRKLFGFRASTGPENPLQSLSDYKSHIAGP